MYAYYIHSIVYFPIERDRSSTHEFKRVNQRKFGKDTSVLRTVTIETYQNKQTIFTADHYFTTPYPAIQFHNKPPSHSSISYNLFTTHLHNKPREKDVKVKRCQEK